MDNTPPEIQASAWEKGFDAIGEHLAGIKQPINYETLAGGDAEIILLGEEHKNTAIHQEIGDHAGELRNSGVTTFLVEASSTPEQDELFALINAGDFSRIDETKIGPLSRAARVQMIKALHSAGIDIFPIDDPRNYERGGSDEGDEARRDEKIKREEYLSKKIAEKTRSKRGKVAVLVGGFHATRGHDMAIDLVEEQGLKCRAVFFAGGTKKSPTMITESAKRAGIADERFMFQAKDRRGPYGGKADWIIHLPQSVEGLSSFSFLY